MEIIKNIEIYHSEALDFLASMFRLNNNHIMLNDIVEYNNKFKPNEEIIKWVNETKKLIPNDIKNKLELFFNFETFFGMCLIKNLVQNNIKTVEDSICYIENIECKHLLESFLATGYTLQNQPNNFNIIVENLLNNEKEAIEFINNNLSIPSQQKWELLQFFLNPKEMKNNLLELLNWYYNNIYINEIEKADKFIYKYEKELEKKLKKYGFEYIKLLTNEVYKNNKQKVIITISYFYEFSCLHSYSDSINKNIYMMGYKYPEIFTEGKHAILAGTQMFKALGDETRLNIIKLLSERPWYGKELAQKLQLSNSTVSHHLSLLTLNGFIVNEKIDNRIYYSLDIKKMKKIINNSIDKIVQ